ncbi:BlaI/MecI/CopY family transcriptional regulator [Filifactor villosus]|uniref:BlaI/MecI/CopY family transcriptional regulator n=1 Tax=Filifactor villosus TaxID=29374 RepID=A0ABV9QLW8_9FIRM
MKFPETEQKVMEVLWDKNILDENGEITAKELSDILIGKYGWSKASCYVYFSRLLKKEMITRRYPNYTIKALVEEEELAQPIIDSLIKDTYKGSAIKLFCAFLDNDNLSSEDIEVMKELISDYKPKKKQKSKKSGR